MERKIRMKFFRVLIIFEDLKWEDEIWREKRVGVEQIWGKPSGVFIRRSREGSVKGPIWRIGSTRFGLIWISILPPSP